MRLVIEILLVAAAIIAAVGYVRIALSPWVDNRELMPQLLIAFILALGFIALMRP